MNDNILDPVDPQALLRVAVHTAGAQAAFARKQGISPSYMSNVLSGHKGFGNDLLAILGCERVTAIVVRGEQL